MVIKHDHYKTCKTTDQYDQALKLGPDAESIIRKADQYGVEAPQLRLIIAEHFAHHRSDFIT